MLNSNGQKSEIWDRWWGNITPLSEIRMWDFYGGRQWITKYVPRYGKVIEGGCGVGRYVFYLKKLGIDIDGIDFSDEVINKLMEVKDNIEPEAIFIKGDILNLPYENNSLAGYISLGVVEHFIEGPQAVLQEAYKKLRPGGIAIITTPNKSFLVRYRNAKTKLKNIVKKIIRYKTVMPDFFQYEYTPMQLKRFIKSTGFHVSRAEGSDFLYPFCEIGGFDGKNLKPNSFAYWFSHAFENTWFNYFGGQSITISVKKAPLMYCFLSGKLTATPDSLQNFDVPISREMQDSKLAQLFKKHKLVRFAESYAITPPLITAEERTCEFSGEKYFTDAVFEDFGFNKNIAPKMLKNPEISIKLSCQNIKAIWRQRKFKYEN